MIVSSDLDEVLGLSHRVMVHSRGKNMDVVEHEGADAERIIALAAS